MIILPPYLSARSAPELVAVCRRVSEEDGPVELDAKQVKFVDPFGLAMLGATFADVRGYGDAVRVHGLSDAIGGYLQRMDAFEGIELVDFTARSANRLDRSDDLVELTHLERGADADAVARQVAHALVGRIPGMDPNEPFDEMSGTNQFELLAGPLQYALTELLENALTHARKGGRNSAEVWVASQYYRSSGLVRFGVVDNGCGFLGSLKGNPALEEETHLAAIRAGIQPFVSCNRELGIVSGSVNEGIGLTTVIRIAGKAEGKVIIVSGDGYYNSKGGSHGIGSSWAGVGIAVECRRNLLHGMEYKALMPRAPGPVPRGLRFV